MENISGVLYGLGTFLAFGLGNAISKTTAKEIGALKSVLFRCIVSSLTLLAIFLLTFKSAPVDAKYIMIAAGIGLAGFLPLASFYKALEKGKIGIVAPVAQTSAIFTVTLAVLFFNEYLSPMRALAILAVTLGVVLLSVNFADVKSSNIFNAKSGILFALGASFGWGLYFFWVKYPVLVLGPILTALIVESSNVVLSYGSLKLKKEKIAISAKMFLYAAVIGLLGVGGVLAFNQGIRVADTTLVVGIYSAAPLIGFLFGKYFYRETYSRLQYGAVAIIIAGIVLLSVS